MALGPGKYDEECSVLRQSTGAEGAFVVVTKGKKGSGFSAQLTPAMMLHLPQTLREMAKEIERSGVTA